MVSRVRKRLINVKRKYKEPKDHMVDTIVKAIQHEGFSFVEVLQPAVAYRNTWAFYTKKTEIIENNGDDYEKALQLAKMKDIFPIGIIYQNREKTPYHYALYGDLHPIKDRLPREECLEKISNLLNSF